jgi:hypothetical protein
MGVVEGAGIIRPPLGVRVRYKVLGLRVAREWRSWAFEDIRSRHWPGQEALRRCILLVPFFAVTAIGEMPELWLWALALLALAFLNLWWVVSRLEQERRDTAAYQRDEAPHWMRRGGPEIPPLRDLAIWGGGGLALGLAIIGAYLILT